MSIAPHRLRLPLAAALRSYWPWLLPLLVTSVVIFALPSTRDHFQLIAMMFFVSAFAAMVPWLFFDAPYSFWVTAAIMWFCSPFVIALVSVLLGAFPTATHLQ